MPKYKVVAGKHFHRESDGSETRYVKGEVLELDAKEAAKHVNKFQMVEESTPSSEGQPVRPGGGDGTSDEKPAQQPQKPGQTQAKK